MNNFNQQKNMDDESFELNEPKHLTKISKSTLQFRQLINNLRAKKNHQECASKIEQNQKNHEEKCFSKLPSEKQIKIDFLVHNTKLVGQQGLKPKLKMQIDGRDTLIKKQKQKQKQRFDNPEDKQRKLQEQQQKEYFLNKEEESFYQNKNLKEQKNKEWVEEVQKNVIFENNESNSAFVVDSDLKIKPQNRINNKNQARAGQIMRQIINQNKFNEKITTLKRIKDIDEKSIIDYLKKEQKLNQKSGATDIFNYFNQLCLACEILIKSPFIKKYKNCIYFGYSIKLDEKYEGLIYFYQGKIYYGQFLNSQKHGHGIEINLIEESISKGEFVEGHKTGKFFVSKLTEQYIGYLVNGLYQGEGKLTTEDYVYEGFFEKGEKHGYGEESYPKTGVKFAGQFRNGIFQRKKISKSKSEFPHNSKKVIKNGRLSSFTSSSLQKHNKRIHKVRHQLNNNPQFMNHEFEFEYENDHNYKEAHQVQKIKYNEGKLKMYFTKSNQNKKKSLPKICQEYDYSLESGSRKNSEMNNTLSERFPKMIQDHKRITNEKQKFNQFMRVETNQFEEPLPSPHLNFPRRKR